MGGETLEPKARVTPPEGDRKSFEDVALGVGKNHQQIYNLTLKEHRLSLMCRSILRFSPRYVGLQWDQGNLRLHSYYSDSKTRRQDVTTRPYSHNDFLKNRWVK